MQTRKKRVREKSQNHPKNSPRLIPESEANEKTKEQPHSTKTSKKKSSQPNSGTKKGKINATQPVVTNKVLQMESTPHPKRKKSFSYEQTESTATSETETDETSTPKQNISSQTENTSTIGNPDESSQRNDPVSVLEAPSVLNEQSERHVSPALQSNIPIERSLSRETPMTQQPVTILHTPAVSTQQRKNPVPNISTEILPAPTQVSRRETCNEPCTSSEALRRDASMQREPIQKKKSISMEELLKRKKTESTSVKANTPSIGSNSPSISDEESDISSENSEVLENMVDQVFNEHNVDDEELDPCIYPAMEPIHWKLDKVFITEKDLYDFLAKEDTWSYRSLKYLKTGLKTLYRCNKVTRNGPQCAAEIFVLKKTIIDDDLIGENPDPQIENEGNVEVSVENQEGQIEPEGDAQQPVDDQIDEDTENKIGRNVFEVHRKNREHNHDELLNKKKQIKPEIENLIIQLHSVGKKPFAIHLTLGDMDDIADEDMPSLKEVRNVIDKNKKKLYGADSITMKQLTEFVDQNMKVPKDIDHAFILSYERSPPNQKDDKYFRFFITTLRFIRMAAMGKNIHADATYKVTTEKIPLIVIGLTDMKKSFHLTGLVISNHETTADYEFAFKSVQLGVRKFAKTEIKPIALISDAAVAIQNGFKNTFGDLDTTIVMCYAHVMGNVERKYKYNNGNDKESMKKDLRILHLAPSGHSFQHGCDLFVEKWKHKEKEVVRKIQGSFFKKNNNWFIGSIFRVPKNNNALESFNGSMKIFQTQFEKKPLKQFKKMAMKIVQQRSKQYKFEKQPFQAELQITEEQMRNGIAYDKKSVHILKESGDVDFFVFRSGIEKEITEEDVKAFQEAQFKTFDEYAEKSGSIHKISFSSDPSQWKNATCTCPAFDASYICKHIIGIANEIGALKEEETPDKNYDDEPLFQSKQGRPSRASKALIKD